MSVNIQELVNFKVNGLNELLTEAEKCQLLKYQKQLHVLQSELKDLQEQIDSVVSFEPTKTFKTINNVTYTRKLLAIDMDYTLEQKSRIFLHGKTNYKLWFLNKASKLCLVTATKIDKASLYLTILLDVKGYKKETHMSLDRFLHLIELGEFTIVNKNFIKYYLKPYYKSDFVQRILNHLNACKTDVENEIHEIVDSYFYKEIEELYNDRKNSLTRRFLTDTKGLKRDVEAEKATRKKAKCEKSQIAIKNLWDSVVTESGKAYFIGWLCGHIDSIHIKVVSGGVSDKVISASYPDEIYGTKYREKANSSGWDASSGKIKFKDLTFLPIETIEALSTSKHLSRRSKTGIEAFKDNTLSNLDLCLFILGNYQKYGFKSGIKNLSEEIDYKKLQEECFPNYYNEFMNGFEI